MNLTAHLTPDQRIAVRLAIEVYAAWGDADTFVGIMREKSQEEIGLTLAGMKTLLDLSLMTLDLKIGGDKADGRLREEFIKTIALELQRQEDEN